MTYFRTMKRVQLWVRAFFGFSRMETNGFLLLIPLMFILLFSESAYRAWVVTPALPHPDKTDSLLAWMDERDRLAAHPERDSITFRLFDPNTVTENELMAFGLDPSVARRWIRYREKGGTFRTMASVGTIYGIDTTWLSQARKWMRIPEPQPNANPKKKRTILEDINTADTIALMDVYGIGPTLARRIVSFRDRLGGFVSMEQVREVYGLDSVVVHRIIRQFEVRSGFQPVQLNLATATPDVLASHPYVSRRQAQAIVAYRSQHGLTAPRELLRINLLDSAWFSRMLPYLKFKME